MKTRQIIDKTKNQIVDQTTKTAIPAETLTLVKKEIKIKTLEFDSYPTPTLDIDSLMISSGEKLPHWQCSNGIYHICFRLADSVPQSLLKHWLYERNCLIENAKQNNEALSEESIRRAQYLYSEQIEKYLDAGCGNCYLNRIEVAQLVINSFIHFNNVRYRLHAWCVMPNHVHVIVEPISGHDLSKIIHSWKSYTAIEANKLLGLTGDFWQRDAYNHIIRSRREYYFQVRYTWENPEKARLHNWKWRWKATLGEAEIT
jgi:REP element-mobilizing transposase RayT